MGVDVDAYKGTHEVLEGRRGSHPDASGLRIDAGPDEPMQDKAGLDGPGTATLVPCA